MTGSGPVGTSTFCYPTGAIAVRCRSSACKRSELDSQILAREVPDAPRGLAVSADMFAADVRIRQEVLKALDRWMTEVTLWHDGWPLAVGHRTTTVQHVLSGAARAFKRHALTAAGISCPVGPTETLRSDMKASLPVDSELIPVG